MRLWIGMNEMAYRETCIDVGSLFIVAWPDHRLLALVINRDKQ